MGDCKTCEHLIFDELWREYICLIHQHIIYEIDKTNSCEFYGKRDKESKTNG
jgi:hypothetical protein